MTDKRPHPHGELISEWIKDTRQLQIRPSGDSELAWLDIPQNVHIVFMSSMEYRFKPEPEVKSSEILEMRNDAVNRSLMEFFRVVLEMRNDGVIRSLMKFFRVVADAAAKRAIEDLGKTGPSY